MRRDLSRAIQRGARRVDALTQDVQDDPRPALASAAADIPEHVDHYLRGTVDRVERRPPLMPCPPLTAVHVAMVDGAIGTAIAHLEMCTRIESELLATLYAARNLARDLRAKMED